MTRTMMAREISEIPDVVERQLTQGYASYQAIGAQLRQCDPAVIVTAARGSSDHAALYFKYLVETRIGRPVASIGPSIASLYQTSLRLDNAALVAISQSGASPDLLSLLDAGRNGGALSIALINADDAPAISHADMIAPLHAGPEIAVAATKSYVASLVASAIIVAEWSSDDELKSALLKLPQTLAAALNCDWSAAEGAFSRSQSVYCIGRGAGLAIAMEAALKFKETCGLHAEGFSSAEVLHGPVALANAAFRSLFFVSTDSSRSSILDTAAHMRKVDADIWLADSVGTGTNRLRTVGAPHPLLEPISQITSFYVFVEQLSRQLGHNPDSPSNLKKVTETV